MGLTVAWHRIQYKKRRALSMYYFTLQSYNMYLESTWFKWWINAISFELFLFEQAVPSWMILAPPPPPPPLIIIMFFFSPTVLSLGLQPRLDWWVPLTLQWSKKDQKDLFCDAIILTEIQCSMWFTGHYHLHAIIDLELKHTLYTIHESENVTFRCVTLLNNLPTGGPLFWKGWRESGGH